MHRLNWTKSIDAAEEAIAHAIGEVRAFNRRKAIWEEEGGEATPADAAHSRRRAELEQQLGFALDTVTRANIRFMTGKDAK